jgi:diaminopropionate ammonia-lyase
MTDIYFNPTQSSPPEPPDRPPIMLHRRLPGYAPTPLFEVPAIAAALGVGRLWVKDESHRCGLPSFKILGASYAVYCALVERIGAVEPAWEDWNTFRGWVAPLRPLTLAAATDGNHGRAVAHMARILDFEAHIFVPCGMAQARIDAIESEGARVTLVDGTYDDAVQRSAAQAGPRCLVISDTSWPGYEAIPRQVIAGYSTIFVEIDAALAASGAAGPDLVAVQMGVGALAAAVVGHYGMVAPRPRLLGVEPEAAACVLASLRAGQIVEIPGPHTSIMAGLNCGAPSLVAWPTVAAGLDACIAIPDERAREAMRALAGAGIVAGETGAASLGGLLEALTGDDCAAIRSRLGVDAACRVLILCTEGATDPDAYTSIVGRPPP